MTIDEARAAADAAAIRCLEAGHPWFAVRVCWNCDSAGSQVRHEDRFPILCSQCEHWYYNGIDITRFPAEDSQAAG